MRLRIVYLLFLFSGLASLVYEIVWGRLLVLTFGNTVQSMVAVITAFLGGLGLGSFIAGRLSDRYDSKRLIQIYAFLEIGVGLTAAGTLLLLPVMRTIYGSLSDGSNVSAGLLVTKFLLAVGVLIWPTTLMGGTLPVLSRWVKLQHKSLAAVVSWLYAVNTLGATLGVVLSTVVLIERFGLSHTVLIAATINGLVGASSLVIARSIDPVAVPEQAVPLVAVSGHNIGAWPILVYSLSGLVSIAYQVLWTRLLTQTAGTFVYAFALILSLYLLGITAGSLLYPLFARLFRNRAFALGMSQLGIGVMALVSVFCASSQAAVSPLVTVIGVVLPATIFMGIAFPATVALLNEQAAARSVGLAYFGNTIGCIFGGFLASFLLIPVIGTLQSVLVLSMVNFILTLLIVTRSPDLQRVVRWSSLGAGIAILLVVGWLSVFKRESLYPRAIQKQLDWVHSNHIDYSFKEDEVASVFGYRDRVRKDQNLYIDMVATTNLVGETRMMAHLPVWLHADPHHVLVVAFGMGSTFRSSLSYGLQTDAVELVPSVPTMMYLFHDDASQVLADPHGRVVINDGRNYVFLTKSKYDIVTIDPPPPFNASGTTVLYSREFYKDIAGKLNPGGIVSQWMWFGARQDDIAMAVRSFLDVFPYVTAWQSPDGNKGIYLEGSFSPIQPDQGSVKSNLNNTQALRDLHQSYPDVGFSDFGGLFLADKARLDRWAGSAPPVTDDYPRTEYFLLRHLLEYSPDLGETDLRKMFAP